MTAGLRLAKSGPALARVSERIAGLDWDRIAQSLDAVGYATTGPLLHSDECAGLVASYPADKGFRSRVIMARHGFGRGEYKYFDYPLPQLVSQLRTAFYPQLAEFANRWNERMGIRKQFPQSHAEYLDRCHNAGQAKATPLLLQYEAGEIIDGRGGES